MWRGRLQQEVLCTDSVEQLGGVPGNEVAKEQVGVGRQKRLGLGLLRGLAVGSLAVATGFLPRHRTVPSLGLGLGTVKAPPLSRLRIRSCFNRAGRLGLGPALGTTARLVAVLPAMGQVISDTSLHATGHARMCASAREYVPVVLTRYLHGCVEVLHQLLDVEVDHLQRRVCGHTNGVRAEQRRVDSRVRARVPCSPY